MNILLLIIISTAGVNSLLMPPSPVGVTTSFAMARDGEAIFYNPANFEAGENFKLWCFYNRFYVSMQSVSMSLSKKIKSIDVGLAIVNFDYGDIEWRPAYPTEDPLIDYSAHDLSIIVGGSAKISSQGRVGLNIKYIYENIYVYSDYTFAFDLSFSYTAKKFGLSFGTSDFGSKITLNNEDVTLPARLKFGGFYTLKKFIGSFDIHYLVNQDALEFGFGIYVPIHKRVALNTALHYRESLYPGFGLVINYGRFGIRYGGAFYPQGLGMINTIGIGLEF